MGCDIHAVIEQRHPKYEEWWVNRGDPEIDRDYELFSVLADVRNDYGITPISEPKGIPEDVDYMFEAYYEHWDADAHSASWVTLKEMKEYDLGQEIDDGHIVLARNENGKITSVCASTSDESKTERVGKRKVFGLWGRKSWDELIKKLEQFSDDTDKNVRLVFFFDN